MKDLKDLKYVINLNQRLINFFCKSPHSRYFKVCGHRVAVTTTQIYHWGARAATENVQTNELDYVPTSLYSQKKEAHRI